MIVAVFGAGGKMGTRIADRLRDDRELELLLVEADPGARTRIEERGLDCTSQEDAAGRADVVVLAVPDWVIGPLAAEVVPQLRAGALLMTLDPAAAYAGHLPERADVAYFVCHPAHPPLFLDETDPEAISDYFGSGRARQSVVNALIQGGEEDYALGERLSRRMWGPILRSHRITLEQMAILEPALSETTVGTCLAVMKEGLDHVVGMGVPEEAARDFILGHVRVIAAVVFGEVPFPLSDGALQAIREGTEVIVRPDWKEQVFDPAAVRRSVERIAAPKGA
jgi:D-apionate oxidoisomerase